MTNWKFSFTRLAVKQRAFLKKNDPNTSDRLGRVLLSIVDTPREGLGKPERLRYKDEEIWSRHLDKKNRIVYEINDEKRIIVVISCLGHYDE
jgi:toxin YoeB